MSASFLGFADSSSGCEQAAGGERTVYSTGNENFYTYHSRRISISIRSAVAERAANNHQKLRRRLTRATVIDRTAMGTRRVRRSAFDVLQGGRPRAPTPVRPLHVVLSLRPVDRERVHLRPVDRVTIHTSHQLHTDRT